MGIAMGYRVPVREYMNNISIKKGICAILQKISVEEWVRF